MWQHTPPMSNLEQLTDHVESNQSELQLIRETLDEIHVDFQWAVQNGRLIEPGPADRMLLTAVEKCADLVDIVFASSDDTVPCTRNVSATNLDSKMETTDINWKSSRRSFACCDRRANGTVNHVVKIFVGEDDP